MPDKVYFAYSGETIYNELTTRQKNSVHKIYSLLPELVAKSKTYLISDSDYPHSHGFLYENVRISFYLSPGTNDRAIIFDIVSEVTSVGTRF